jgi:tRNA threonylcarbamoyl adenosine modification protein YeaZ
MKKKNIQLYIDTSSNEKTVVAIIIDGIRKEKEHIGKVVSSQILLPLIQSIIEENSIVLSDLTEILVHTGPGSYTGLRVGIAVASTIGYVFQIPVNGQLNKPIDPIYG